MEAKYVHEVFEGVMQFWETAIKPIMEEINTEMSDEELLRCVNEMWEGAKDKPVRGIEFPWDKTLIIDNDNRQCVQGTILAVSGINADKSIIRSIFRTFTVTLKCIKGLLEENNPYKYIDAAQRYSPGCIVDNKIDKNACIQVIKELIPITFGENGAFSQIREKMNTGEWKI